ncbi:MAG: FUSC family protein [Hyphomicrobiaceae bacterium]|nr:FUSC family protein [Hyphomicrobiaceae bacterium]
MSKVTSLSSWDIIYALDMAIACAISYWAITHALQPLTDRDSDLLGGMWAVAATVFVFRETRRVSVSAGLARLIATCVSFALCLIYLWFFPFTPLGMAALLGIGTLAMMLLDRRGDIVTTGITTAVVMVVAGMSPLNAWHQPLLRLIDTVVGIAIGVACKWIASHVFFRITGKPVR